MEHPSYQSSARAGRRWMLAAAVLWSTSGLFAKSPLFADWPEATRGALLGFWRALFAAAVLALFVRRARWRVGLVPLGLCFAGMNLGYLTAMSLTTAANAIWLQMTAPAWVFVIGLALFRQRIGRADAVPLAFGLAGVAVILGCEVFLVEVPRPAGVLCGLASGLFYAGVIVAMHRLSGENPAWLVAFSHAVAAALLFPVVVRQGVWPSPIQLGVLAGFGALQMAVPYVCLLRALRHISSQEAVAIGLIEPLLVPLWVLLVWGETPAWWTVIGGGLILAGLALRYFAIDRFASAPPASAAAGLPGSADRQQGS